MTKANCICGGKISIDGKRGIRATRIECLRCHRIVGGLDKEEAFKMWNSAMKGLLNG